VYRVRYWPCVEIVAKGLEGHGGLNPPMNLPQLAESTRNRDVSNLMPRAGLGFMKAGV